MYDLFFPYLSKVLFELVGLELQCLFEIVVFWHDGDFGAFDFGDGALEVEQLALDDLHPVAVGEVVHLLLLAGGHLDAHPFRGLLELFQLGQGRFHPLGQDGAHHKVLVEVALPGEPVALEHHEVAVVVDLSSDGPRGRIEKPIENCACT